jgi:hypothetical protein
MFRTLPRARTIPQGAVKVADKLSDAVVYIYEAGGRPAAIGYHGKAAKPDFWLRFTTAERREAYVRQFFQGWQAHAERIAASKAQALKPHNLELGHILVASWGYDQTNVDWFQVTRLVSSTMVEVRPIASKSAGETGWMTGRCIPDADAFTGEATRHRVSHGGVKINESVRAYVWDGRPRSWSSYH